MHEDRSVLFVVHTVTAATRLLDVLPIFDGDPRVSLAFTCPGSSPFVDGVAELFAERGVVDLGWDDACQRRFGLAISASHGGPLWQLQAPIVILPHGMGYNKYLDIAGGRPSGRTVFGLSDPWVLHDGKPIATAQALSHTEQLDRFRQAAPGAASTAVVVGDPCYDRLLESLPDRDLYRAALGLDDTRRLVVVNTTWGPRSLFGQWVGLVEQLVAGLPVDEYRVAAVVHPNVIHAHGAAEVNRVLAHARRGGLLVAPHVEGWRAVLVAADALIGDHGSVPFYAAALGVPTALATFPADDIDPASPIARFGRSAPRILADHPIRAQIEELVAGHEPTRHAEVAASVTSCPGRSLELLRELTYRLLGLTEPPWPVVPEPVPVLRSPAERVSPLWARVIDGRVERFPAAVGHAADGLDGAHLVVDATRPMGRDAEMADVLIRDAAGAPPGWAARMLDRLPGLTVAALIDGDLCRATLRDGSQTVWRAEAGADPGLLASLLFAEKHGADSRHGR